MAGDPEHGHGEDQASQGYKAESGDHDDAAQHCQHACGV
jgi:hypothetical protein